MTDGKGDGLIPRLVPAPPPAAASIVVDLSTGRLWIDDTTVELRPKTWEVLCAPLPPGSMLRELAAAVDEIARQRTLVLVIEDAHWADLASTDACSMLARHRDPARLLLVVTKRSAETTVLEHPVGDLRRDLVLHRLAEEIAVVPFGQDALGRYLEVRCPGLESQLEIVECLLQQTAGNPLFVRLVVDEWIERGLVTRSESDRWSLTGDSREIREAVPDSLRVLLERQVAQLDPAERTVLEAASVRVGEFLPASVAAAAAMDPEDVEDLCDRWCANRSSTLGCTATTANASPARSPPGASR